MFRPEKLRAWGMPGARCTRSLICKRVKAYERCHREVHRFHPAFPHAMVLTVSFGLFPVIGLCCHRRQRDTTRSLDASIEASEPHDFAVRLRAVRQQHISVHRIPFPTSVTIAKRPSWWAGMARLMDLIWEKREGVCFCNWDWTGQIRLIRLNKSAFCKKVSRCHPDAPQATRPARSGQDTFLTTRYNPSARKMEECP